MTWITELLASDDASRFLQALALRREAGFDDPVLDRLLPTEVNQVLELRREQLGRPPEVAFFAVVEALVAVMQSENPREALDPEAAYQRLVEEIRARLLGEGRGP